MTKQLWSSSIYHSIYIQNYEFIYLKQNKQQTKNPFVSIRFSVRTTCFGCFKLSFYGAEGKGLRGNGNLLVCTVITGMFISVFFFFNRSEKEFASRIYIINFYTDAKDTIRK